MYNTIIKIFNLIFPKLDISNDNKYYFCNVEGNAKLQVDIHSPIAKKIIPKAAIKASHKQNQKYEKLNKILTEEQKKKYCLIFDNKICFGFNTNEEAMQKIKDDGINYIIYYPQN
jgi:hypothetical protein